MTRTATFEIVNAKKRRALPCAWLTFDSIKGWEIVISREVTVNDVPALFIPFMEKDEFVIGGKWAQAWVEERIIPPGRQNLNEILAKHGLLEYDELTLLRSSKGFSSLDDFIVREIDLGRGVLEQKAMLQKRIGQAIRHKRVDMKMTQSELARRLGIHQSALSNIEQGKTNPTIDMLFDISSALGGSIGDLIDAPDDPLWNSHREDLFHFLQKVSFGCKPHRHNNHHDLPEGLDEDSGKDSDKETFAHDLELAYSYKRLIDELETYSELSESAVVDSEIIGSCLRKIGRVLINDDTSSQVFDFGDRAPIERDAYVKALDHIETLLQAKLDAYSDVLSDVERVLRRANSIDAQGNYTAPLHDEVVKVYAIVKEYNLESWFYRELNNSLWIDALKVIAVEDATLLERIMIVERERSEGLSVDAFEATAALRNKYGI